MLAASPVTRRLPGRWHGVPAVLRALLGGCLLVAVLLGGAPAAPARSAEAVVPGICQDGRLPHGALWLICTPRRGWNGDLVVWAHGYVAFNEPVDFYNLTLPDGTYLPLLVQSLGFAFATTSYRANGLVVLEGAEDIRELVAAFRQVEGRSPRRTYLTGGSEGGLIATILAERSPHLFDGVLAACGPIGSFRRQIDYVGDFRVLFDYFFPGVIPGSPAAIPAEVIANWETKYVPRVRAALAADPQAARELIRTSGAAIDPRDPATIEQTTLDVLWYNVFGSNDTQQKLGGNPYDNRRRVYRGSSNDLRLNLLVERFRADPAALRALARYETSGRVSLPLVLMHTTGDDIIPFFHLQLYRQKARTVGDGRLTFIPVQRYGHCNFTSEELLAAFGLLVLQVSAR